MQGSQATAAVESEELVRFRQQWLQEVRQKKGQPSSTTSPAGPPPSATASASNEEQARPQSPPAHRTAHRRMSHDAPSPPASVRKPATPSAVAQFSPALLRAVEVYSTAVQHEQRSELNEALRLYRTAFRMDSNVDRAYHTIEEQLHAKAVASAHKAHHQKSGSSSGAVDGLVQEMQGLKIAPAQIPVAHARGEVFVTGTLATLISSWPIDLKFEPEDQQEGVPIQTLPDELLMLILRMLDHTALERFARVNRKARVISLDASIWR